MGAIAKKLGFGDKLPQTEEELRSWLLSGTAPYAGDFGTSADQKKEKHYKKYETGELRADGKPGFPTPSGKLEICSTILEENGFVPYPKYKDVRSIPELAGKEYPFTMTSGARSNNRMGVFGANLDKIAEIEPYPFVDINAEDAKEIGIEDGDIVKVITPFADGTFKAKIRGIARHAIHIPHGGGSAYMAEPWKNGNVNDLCSLDYADPMTGFVLIKSVPCRVEKV
jgi:anaerobic selenocysteine-containing dehydrogenase